MATIRENVEKILRLDELSRGDDKRLMVMYWEIIDEVDFSKFDKDFVEKATMPESIRRARQLIQEEGLYLPDDKIVLKRRLRQGKMKKAIVEEREVI